MSSSNKKVKPIFFMTAQRLIVVRITVFFSEIVFIVFSIMSRINNILLSSTELRKPKLFWSGEGEAVCHNHAKPDKGVRKELLEHTCPRINTRNDDETTSTHNQILESRSRLVPT